MKKSKFRLCYALCIFSIPVSFVLSEFVFWLINFIDFYCQSIDLPLLTYSELGLPLVLCINIISLIHAIDINSRLE